MSSNEQTKFFTEMVDTVYEAQGIQTSAQTPETIFGGLRFCRSMDYAPWEGEMVRKIIPLEDSFGPDARGLEFAVRDSREDTIFRCFAPRVGYIALGGAAESGSWRALDDDEAQLLVDWLQDSKAEAQTALKELRKMTDQERANQAATAARAARRSLERRQRLTRDAQYQATVRFARTSKWRQEGRRRARRIDMLQ